MQPFTFVYDLVADETVIESNLAKTHPFLYGFMPFNFVSIQAEREAIFYINQDPEKALIVPVGGGIVEADNVNLWSWSIKNKYLGSNKVYVVVQKE